MMKRLLALLLALVCVISMVACSGEKAKKAEEETVTEEDAREVAEGFMDAYVQLDVDGMKKYIDDPAVLDDELGEGFDIEAMIDELVEESVAENPELESIKEEMRSLMSTVMYKYIGTLSYEILDVEEDDGTFTYTVELTIPDENTDMSEYMELDEEAYASLIMEGISNGTITTTEDVYSVIFGAMEEKIAEIEFDTTTKEVKLVVREVDGELKVIAEESSEFTEDLNITTPGFFDFN